MDPKLDRAAFEAEILDYDEESRGEYRVEQICPVWSTGREALLLVRPHEEAEEAVEDILDAFSDRMQAFFRTMSSATVDRAWRGKGGARLENIPSGRDFVRLAHDSDRNYSGYENIYRGIRALAPHLEDCRFVISEGYGTWVDEYRVVDGELLFERGRAKTDYIDDLLAYYEREAQDRGDDPPWIRFAARALADWAAFHLGQAEHPSKAEAERTRHLGTGRSLVERALALHRGTMVCAQMARLLRLEDRPAEAREWFERHAALTADPETLLSAAFASVEEGDAAGAQSWLGRLLEAAPEHRAAHQLLGLLAHQASEHERSREHMRDAFELCVAAHEAGHDVAKHAELLHRNGLYKELLEVYVSALDEHLETEARREVLALELLVWAELFRIKMCHDIAKPESTELAALYYDRVHSLDELGGRVSVAHALYLRQAELPGSDALLESLLEADADHLEALSELGASAFDEGAWPLAIERLERAVLRSLETGTGGYHRGLDSSRLITAMLNQGNALLEVGGDADCAAADALFERGLAMVELLDGSRAAWFALVLRRSVAHTLRGRHAEALALAEEACLLAPDSVHAMSEVASCLNNLGNYEDALAAVALAAELEPEVWHVPYVQACVLAKTDGPLAKIIALLARAIELSPDHREMIADDPDFEAIRASAAFRALVKGDPAGNAGTS